jgi:hypothetical protein
MRANGPLRRNLRPLAILLAICLVLGRHGDGQPSDPSEYEVKAVMLYNFAMFVEWPAAESPSARTPLVVGVLGRDPFGAALDAITRGRNSPQMRVVVRRFGDLSHLDSCHILFISGSEKGSLPEVLAAVGRRSVLTVSDMEAFARAGGIIGFVLQAGKIRFEINHEAARRANLTVSSRLLQLASIVVSEKGG